jgi:hypothetical protein
LVVVVGAGRVVVGAAVVVLVAEDAVVVGAALDELGRSEVATTGVLPPAAVVFDEHAVIVATPARQMPISKFLLRTASSR